MKKTVLFLTSAYPYFPGEQFIEDEIVFWGEQQNVDVVVAPGLAKGIPRPIPKSIDVDLSLMSSSKFEKLGFALFALFAKFFWLEVIFIVKNHGICRLNLTTALRSAASILYFASRIKKLVRSRGVIDVAYCYWNDHPAYAAILMKRVGLFNSVMSRAHGFDVYEDRRTNGYMPFKRQFINEFDHIFAISNQGKKYLESTYGGSREIISVSRLGVPVPSAVASVSGIGYLHIVSVSFCVPVKRIDKIIEGIALADDALPDVKITWTHIGSGPLLENLSMIAKDRFSKTGVKFIFTGDLQNADVKNFFGLNPVDLFVNASESEGVPVSIMEAMSYGVPVVAPDVGGVSEIVTDDVGLLMRASPEPIDLCNAIVELSKKAKCDDFRQGVKARVKVDYSACTNYLEFIRLVTKTH
jgi:glycosyltransferase involved in cell wall biosynthesis